MSTVKVANIQHPDASGPSIELSSDGSVSISSFPIIDSGTNATGAGSKVTISFSKTFSSPPTIALTAIKSLRDAEPYIVIAGDNVSPEVSTTEMNVASYGYHNDNAALNFQWIAVGE